MGTLRRRYTREQGYAGADLLIRVYTNQLEDCGDPETEDWLVLDVAVPDNRKDIRRFLFQDESKKRKLFVFSKSEDLVTSVGVVLKRMLNKYAPNATAIVSNELPTGIMYRAEIERYLVQFVSEEVSLLLQIPDVVSDITPKGSICKYCHKSGLVWKNWPYGWRLMEQNNYFHECPPRHAR